MMTRIVEPVMHGGFVMHEHEVVVIEGERRLVFFSDFEDLKTAIISDPHRLSDAMHIGVVAKDDNGKMGPSLVNNQGEAGDGFSRQLSIFSQRIAGDYYSVNYILKNVEF